MLYAFPPTLYTNVHNRHNLEQKKHVYIPTNIMEANTDDKMLNDTIAIMISNLYVERLCLLYGVYSS